MTKLAIVTTEWLPIFPFPCAGGGVRAWGLGETLRRAGIECIYFLPEEKLQSSPLPLGVSIQPYRPEGLAHSIEERGCEAALFEQWQPLTFLQEELPVPIAVDLPGPLSMEYYWRDPENYLQHLADKAECLRKADYYICALERQRGYYLAWLLWAGVPPEENRLSVLPFCFPDMPFSRMGHVEDEPIFFWGGMFWPWQDRVRAFSAMASTLLQIRQGQLVIAGGGNGDTQNGWAEFDDHPHVSWLGTLPFAEYVGELKRATVAVDVCQPTAERQLSSDLRTGTSLWAGVPCLVTRESAWAEAIEENNAGWVIDYNDEKTLRALTKDIALERVDIAAKRRGAREVSQRISAELKTHPLLDWLKNPSKRERRETFLTARKEDGETRLRRLQQEADRLRFERDTAQQNLDSIRSKPVFKMYKSLTGWINKIR